MSFLDEFANAVHEATRGLQQRADERHAAFWRSHQPLIEAAGVTDLAREGRRLIGRVEGATVKMQVYESDESVRTRFEWTFDTPIDASIVLRTPNALEQIGKLFGHKTPTVKAGSNRTSEFALTEGIRNVATHLAQTHSFELSRTFSASTAGIDFAGLPAQVSIVESLVDRWGHRLDALAELGFGPSGMGVWHGRVDGVPCRIVETRKRGFFTTTVHAQLARPLPPETSLEKRRKSGKQHRNRRKIRDLVLDQVLVARSSNMNAVRDRVAREPARSELIGLLGTYKGSHLRSDEVVIRLPGAVVDVCEVPAIVRLVGALDAP